MKKSILLVMLLLPFSVLAQKSFTLIGQIADTTKADMAYLRYYSNSRPKTDSAQIIIGKFKFSGPLNSITLANLSVAHEEKINDIKSLYIEYGVMKVLSATPYIKDAKIIGSPMNDDNALLNELTKPLDKKTDELNREWLSLSDGQRADSAVFKAFNNRSQKLQAEFNAMRKKFGMDHPNSYVGLAAYAVSHAIDLKSNLPATEKDFNRFSAEVRASDIGKTISGMIEGAKGTRGGLLAMDFTQNDPDGHPRKLSDFRGKYVLLDFWASWCGPCRAETPFLIKAYHDFKDKNFDILSVSLEKPGDRDSWLKAIQKDGMVWNNVSDLNFWQNDAAVKYGITSIPANFLLDPAGKIIAKNLRGKELELKLAELLK